MAKKKLMINDFYRMKQEGLKITWLTSYDFPTAQFAEAAGLDMLLVGDSLGMCVMGSREPFRLLWTSASCTARLSGVGLQTPS